MSTMNDPASMIALKKAKVDVEDDTIADGQVVENNHLAGNKSSNLNPFEPVKKDEVDLLLVGDNEELPAAPEPIDDAELETDDEINPFLLNPVLNILMGQMSISDLMIARLVSNCWSEKATKYLEKAAQNDQFKPFQIMCDTSCFYDEALNKNIFNHFELDFDFYIKQIGKKHDIKFLEKYKVTWIKLKHTDFLKGHGLGHLLNLLNVISPIVKYLEFAHVIHFRKLCEITPAEPDYNVILQQAEFTNLEEFIFTTDHEGFSRYSPQKPYSYILSSILNNSPKLKSITIADEFPKCQEFYEILKNSQALKTITKLTIENLSFKKKVTGGEEMIRNFGQDFSNLQLQELKITHVDKNFSSLYEFLCSQALTLKSLEIDFHFYGNESFKIKWPTFENLKVLKIYFNFGEMYSFSELNWADLFEPFILNEKFPQLVHLELNNLKGFLQIAPEGSKSIKILKSIEYNYEEHDDPSVKFRYKYSTFNYFELFEKFPSLHTIGTNGSDLVLAKLNDDCDLFWIETLKELHLYIYDLDDLLHFKLNHLKRLEFLYIEYYDLIDNEFAYYDRENDRCEMFTRTTVQENCEKLIENMTLFIKDLKKIKKISFKFNLRVYEYNEDMGEQDIEQRVLDLIAENFSGSNIEFCLEKP